MREYINIGWCSPYRIKTSNGEEIIIAINEQDLAGCRINGVDSKLTLPEIARRCNPAYDEYGWDDVGIILDSGDVESLECAECPWRDICDQQVPEETESCLDIPVEYQDGFEFPHETWEELV